MYLAASIPPRDEGPRPSSRSSARYLTWARSLFSSITEAADSASLDSFRSARFSDIILSKAGREGEATTALRLPRLARLALRFLARALLFAPPFFFLALLLARRCAIETSALIGQIRPKQIMKTNRRINGRFFFIILKFSAQRCAYDKIHCTDSLPFT